MKDHIKKYKEKLKKVICEYMDSPVTERSAEAVRMLSKALLKVEELEAGMDYGFTHEDAQAWNAGMENADGTTGGHWTIDQTTAVAEENGVKFDHISDWCWNTAMNMMYSDYSTVAEKFGVGTPEFYADLAKAFLFDKDGGSPKCKMSAYYHGIVDHDIY